VIESIVIENNNKSTVFMDFNFPLFVKCKLLTNQPRWKIVLGYWILTLDIPHNKKTWIQPLVVLLRKPCKEENFLEYNSFSYNKNIGDVLNQFFLLYLQCLPS